MLGDIAAEPQRQIGGGLGRIIVCAATGVSERVILVNSYSTLRLVRRPFFPPDVVNPIDDRVPKLRPARRLMEKRHRPVGARSLFQFYGHLIRKIRLDVVIPSFFEMKNI